MTPDRASAICPTLLFLIQLEGRRAEPTLSPAPLNIRARRPGRAHAQWCQASWPPRKGPPPLERIDRSRQAKPSQAIHAGPYGLSLSLSPPKLHIYLTNSDRAKLINRLYLEFVICIKKKKK